jgi:trans-aconitate methyltransferase
MQAMQENFTHWMEWFPKQALFGDGKRSGEIFMVDVGGGYGHDVSVLAATYPDEQIRMIVQDLSGVLQEGENKLKEAGKTLDPRIELAPHDFFQKQPLKGAEIYYMHKIMHDWPDKDCVLILEHLRDAMTPNSRILINDCILPNQGCPLR